MVTDEIAAVVRAPGQIDLFVRSSDGATYTKARNSAGAWWPWLTSWAWLGGDALGPASVVSTGSSHLAVATRGSDNVVRIRSWYGGSW